MKSTRSRFIYPLSLGLFILSFAYISWQLLTPAPAVQVGGYDKLYHMAGFGWLGLTAFMTWYDKPDYWPYIAAALCCYGLATEILQHLIPSRSFSIYDWLADGAGVMLAYGVSRWLAHLLRFRLRLR